MSSLSFLPSPSSPESHVTISPIVAGIFTLPDSAFLSDSDPFTKRTAPSLAFLITHSDPPARLPFNIQLSPGQPLRILFDLGLRKQTSRYDPQQQKHLENRRPYDLKPGVAAQLLEYGVDPGSINAVILSHVHYDHHGDPEDFPNATFLVGNGSLNVVANGLGGIASHQVFQRDLFEGCTVVELPHPNDNDKASETPQWQCLGPFDALDILEDGSLLIIDAPGHLPGHINLLCRMANESWVALCGDSYHDIRLLTGEREIGTWADAQGRICCIHLDREKAKLNIGRIRMLQEAGVECVAAHDDRWLERSRREGKILPGLL